MLKKEVRKEKEGRMEGDKRLWILTKLNRIPVEFIRVITSQKCLMSYLERDLSTFKLA